MSSNNDNKKETPLSDVKVQPIDESLANPNRFRHEPSNVVQMGQQIAEGQLPSNSTITAEMNDAANYMKEREMASHNRDEAKVIRDVREFVETAKDTLLEKNRDDLAQRFVDDLNVLAEKAKNVDTVNSPTDMIVQASKFLCASKNILITALKSPNFRQALLDFFTVIRDVFNRLDTSRLKEAINNPNAGLTDVAGAAKDTAVDFKDKNQDKGMPESSRDVRADFRKLLQELNQSPESTEAFRAILNIWNMLSAEFYNLMDQALNDPTVANLFSEAKQIVEGYCGGRSLDALWVKLRYVMSLIQNDQELSNYVNQWQQFFQRALDNPALIEQDSFYDEGSRLWDKGSQIMQKYQDNEHIIGLLDETIEIGRAMSNDESMAKLKEKAEQIGKDLTYTDAKGNTHVDTDFVSMIRNEVIPFFNNRIKEIPVPGFQVTSEEFHHLIVDDIYVTVDDIIPDRIKISSAQSSEFKINEEDPLKTRAYVDIKVDGVKIKVKDFYFNFKRKTPVGNVSDEGRADLKVTGDGLHVHIRYELSVDAKRGVPCLQNAVVEVNLDNVELDILEANHKVLLNMATTLFKGRIQKDVEQTIKIKIEEAGQDLADLLNKQIISNISPIGITGLLKTNLIGTVTSNLYGVSSGGSSSSTSNTSSSSSNNTSSSNVSSGTSNLSTGTTTTGTSMEKTAPMNGGMNATQVIE